jgi:hypothetical protein
MWRIIRWTKDVFDSVWFIWTLLGLLGVSGLVVMGTAIWAALKGEPIPIGVMVAFCVLVASICLVMAPRLLRSGTVAAPSKPTKSHPEPN